MQSAIIAGTCLPAIAVGCWFRYRYIRDTYAKRHGGKR